MACVVQLRDYQTEVEESIHDRWAIQPLCNVLAVVPTGGGKTVVFAKIMYDNVGPSIAIAHRQELVSQISIALARNGVYHRLIASSALIKIVVKLHMDELGRHFYDPTAMCSVASVDTLVNKNGTGVDGDYYTRKADDGVFEIFGPRTDGYWGEGSLADYELPGSLTGKSRPRNIDINFKSYSQSVTLWVQDEAHHVQEHNKWGTAAAMFPGARGLGVTATPKRADGGGLGRHHEGVFDYMVEGPTLRELITRGYLTDYKIYAPPSNLDLDSVAISKTTGDRNINQLRDATAKSSLVVPGDDKNRVVGDIVEHYLKIAPGKLGITFVPSVAIAEKVAAQFNLAGVPAAVVSAKTPDADRARILREFKQRKILQLVNCDLFGEGFDLPAIEVVSMARRTESFALFVQQAGRALRLLDGKEFAIIIDHVGNVARHAKLIKEGDKYIMDLCNQKWSLDRRGKRGSNNDEDQGLDQRVCLNNLCFLPFDRALSACPRCGKELPEPVSREDVKFVDGDLYELDQATLARMHGDIATVDKPLQEQLLDYRRELQDQRIPKQWEWKHVNSRALKIDSQMKTLEGLRETMAWWAGHHRTNGRGDREIFKLFYLQFGVDWLSAQALPGDEMAKLGERVLVNTGVF